MTRVNGPSSRKPYIVNTLHLPSRSCTAHVKGTNRLNRFLRESDSSHRGPKTNSVRNGNGSTSNSVQLEEPLVISCRNIGILPPNEFSYHFSKLSDRKKLVKGFDAIWQSGNLFSEKDKPCSSFYSDYIEFLLGVLKENLPYFSSFTFNGLERNWNIDTTFEREFRRLANKTDLDELQKSISLAQALELALIGINPTPVLASINNQSDGIHARGFRNELLAAWYLAKFVYRLKPNGPPEFTLSEILPTVRRDFDKGKVFNTVYDREVDIRTPNALVSVRSAGNNNYSSQIADLFFIVVDDENLSLKGNIEKIILVRNAEKKDQLLPDYWNSVEYKQIRDGAIIRAREKVRKFPMLNGIQQSFNNLISKNGIEIYFIPSLNDLNALEGWIDQNYKPLKQYR